MKVDIAEAFKVMGTSVLFSGGSTDDLIKEVQARPEFAAGGSKLLSVAQGLEGGIHLRAIDAVHELSYATRPLYGDDVFDLYVQWGLLRYLGLFDIQPKGASYPALQMSDAGCRIAGNQRRLTSEEMGIGFGVHLSRRWFKQAGVGAAISVTDVDVALRSGVGFGAGTRRRVRQVADKRPDYLLVVSDAGSPMSYRIRALECKGTSSPSYATAQLARAAEQLNGLTVGGRIPTGLAVSTITGNNEVSYLAIDPSDEEDPSYEVNSTTVQRSRTFDLAGRGRNVPASELASATVSGSWAMLADYAGNLEGLERWAPNVMQSGLSRRQRDRPTIETPFGPAIGTRINFEVQNRRLTVWYAVSKSIDVQLSQGSAEDLAESQIEFARPLSTEPDALTIGEEDAIFSATPDGSIFALVLE